MLVFFDKNKEEYAQLATREMGKVIGQSRKEIEKCWYADIMQKMQLHYYDDVKTEATKSYITFNPLEYFSGNAMELSILSSYSLLFHH
jgi:succinate-semialdehyde dehydrogenase/glutarate-semialdehyde dehydrogenase